MKKLGLIVLLLGIFMMFIIGFLSDQPDKLPDDGYYDYPTQIDPGVQPGDEPNVQPGSEPDEQNDPVIEVTGMEAKIVGQWAAYQQTGDVSWDFLITFYKDGTYKNVSSMDGSRYSDSGTFKIDGNNIVFYSADGTADAQSFKYENPDRISINWTPYQRVKQ